MGWLGFFDFVRISALLNHFLCVFSFLGFGGLLYPPRQCSLRVVAAAAAAARGAVPAAGPRPHGASVVATSVGRSGRATATRAPGVLLGNDAGETSDAVELARVSVVVRGAVTAEVLLLVVDRLLLAALRAAVVLGADHARVAASLALGASAALAPLLLLPAVPRVTATAAATGARRTAAATTAAGAGVAPAAAPTRRQLATATATGAVELTPAAAARGEPLARAAATTGRPAAPAGDRTAPAHAATVAATTLAPAAATDPAALLVLRLDLRVRHGLLVARSGGVGGVEGEGDAQPGDETLDLQGVRTVARRGLLLVLVGDLRGGDLRHGVEALHAPLHDLSDGHHTGDRLAAPLEDHGPSLSLKVVDHVGDVLLRWPLRAHLESALGHITLRLLLALRDLFVLLEVSARRHFLFSCVRLTKATRLET
eukprot:Hpha_TRINITY_DN16787_c2_g6::TRINITY_DN16787_c2_g6_i1::g.76172::m.76172